MEGHNNVTHPSLAGNLLFYVIPLLTGGVAWVTTQIAALTAAAHSLLTLLFGADVGGFIADPAHFPGICMVLVATVQGLVRLYMWWKDNALRKERDELHRRLVGRHGARGSRH